MKKQDFITWASVNNWIPLIALAVSIALTFGATLTRIAILEEKIETQNAYIADIKADQKEILSLLRDYQVENQKLSLRINTLETIQVTKK